MKKLPPSLGQVLGRAYRPAKKDPQTHFDLLDLTRGILETIIVEDSPVARDNIERLDDDAEIDDWDDDDDWDEFDDDYDEWDDDDFDDDDDDEETDDDLTV